MRRIPFSALLFCLFHFAASANPAQFGTGMLFNEGWKFILDDVSSYSSVSFDDSRWRQLDLPHDWSCEGTASLSLSSCQGYLPAGVGWYRRHFRLRDLPRGETYGIYFDGVYNRSEVYLNGHLLGRRPNGYVSFMYDMTPYLNTHGDNVIAVRVDHSRSADSRYYTGSGIYRSVWVVAAPRTRLSQWGLSYELVSIDDRVAEIDVLSSTTPITASGYSLSAVITDADGRVAARSSEVPLAVGSETAHRLRVRIESPRRWDISSPYLYRLTVTLSHNRRSICTGSVSMGLRETAFTPDGGFFLNGRNVKLKGVCLHHDFGVLGSAVPKDVWRRRLTTLQSLGVNAIRTSHNPESADFYDLCDELGLLVMDEAFDEWEYPKRKWLEGWNVGIPGYDGTFDFFEEWSSRDVSDMVLRDRCHPCVIMWSIGNEVDYPNDPYTHPVLNGSAIQQPMYGGYDPRRPSAERIGIIGSRLAETVRAIDRTRPVTGALAGVVMSNETIYPQSLDIVGYNYTEDRYDTDHSRYPERIIYGSENGMSYDAWKACRDRRFIAGQFLWTGADYLGESSRWPSRGLGTGLLDFCSLPKPRGRFREALWSEKKVIYIGTFPVMPENDRHMSIDDPDDWNYLPGMYVRVSCYTNCIDATLYLDDRKIGETKLYDDKTGIITWDVEYAPGDLKVVGTDGNGKVEATYTIPETGAFDRLKVTPDRIKLKKGEVAHVMIEAIDSRGNVIKNYIKNVKCTVGKGLRLLGVESGDNTDMTNYKADHRRMHRGRLMAYVMAVAKTADVKLDAEVMTSGK